MRRWSVFLLSIPLTLAPRFGFAKRPITFEDLMRIQRISDPHVSPDGQWVAYVQTSPDLATNKKPAHIWVVPVAGGDARQITSGDSMESSPQWSPDSKSIAFVSMRDGKSQVWIAPLTGDGEHQVTQLSTEADSVIWSSQSNRLLFTSRVYPDCRDDDCNRQRLQEADSSKVKARTITDLLFRHWDQWREGRYEHTFVIKADGGLASDLTPGAYDSPTFFLEAPPGVAISPNGEEACYVSNRTGHPAWATNDDIYCLPSTGGQVKDITLSNPGSDNAPQYSPDGRFIAYTSQATNGYESALFRLRVYNRQTHAITQPSGSFDQWVENFAWAPDSKSLYFLAPERAENPVFRVDLNAPGQVKKVLGGFNEDIQSTPDGRSLILTRSAINHPTEIYRVSVSGGDLVQLTHANDALVAELDMPPLESYWVNGALGARIQCLLAKPPGFNRAKKYPGLLLIHGGPQSAWSDSWGYRWNAYMFASHGYVVLMPNPHGSTGYGQKFVAEISGDWGGAAYRDVMAAADRLQSLPYVDSARIGAAGASFGGYMIDWIAGHTARFKCLVSHDGVYDLRSMYGETEELWFPEWELKGLPWRNSILYERWSPSKFVQNVRTPTLIVQGERDFRVPTGQGLQFFTALQRRGIPSRLLYFPDEGHWVLKPQNSRLWYETVLGWLDHYLKPDIGPTTAGGK